VSCRHLIGVLLWCINTLADAFGRVFVPCVTGNHGRNTHKIRAKGRNFTSVDWLIYQMLEMQFAGDARSRSTSPTAPTRTTASTGTATCSRTATSSAAATA
jgi:hypothetical protein